MPQFRIHRWVEQEFREVHAWYAERSPLAAENFVLRFDFALKGVERNPTKHAFWRKPFRRVRLVRFPYLLIYHQNSLTISVLALVHEHREPKSTFTTLNRRTESWHE
jgi:plasmid stabilization system protein ParE